MPNYTLKMALTLCCATEKQERIKPYTRVLCGHALDSRLVLPY